MIPKSEAYAIVRRSDRVVIAKGSKRAMILWLNKQADTTQYMLYQTWYKVGQTVSY